jgi:ribosomal protein L7Ae-like RNA K-turn-binding protein
MIKAKVKTKTKASAPEKRSLNSVTRLELEPVRAEIKDGIIDKLRALQAMGAVRDHFLVGSNSVAKALETSNVSVLVVCKDSPACLTNHLVESARWRKVPIVVVHKFVMELRSCLKLKSASCFAIPIRSTTAITAVTASSNSVAKKEKNKEEKVVARTDEEIDFISSSVDSFKEHLHSLVQ